MSILVEIFVGSNNIFVPIYIGMKSSIEEEAHERIEAMLLLLDDPYCPSQVLLLGCFYFLPF